MEDDFVDESFLLDVEASKDLTKRRQDARGAKDGEVTLTGTLESYMTKVTENKQVHNVPTTAPPRTEMMQTLDKKKSYPAPITMNIRLTRLDGQCEARTDGKPGWRVRAVLHYFNEAKEYLQLRENYQKIWSDAAAEKEPELMRMREYVDAEGNLAATKWLTVSHGDVVKVKVGDRKDGKEDNIFRKENPARKGMLLVQPSTPIKFGNIVAQVYVNVVNKKEDAKAGADASGETSAGHESGDAAGPRTKVIQASPSYNCKGGQSVSEDYDPNLGPTERLHDTEDKYAHNMVPIAELRANPAAAPRSVYFYVKKSSMTRWTPESDPNMKGLTVIRDCEADTKDCMSEWQDVKKATCVVRFDVYQWRAGDQDKKANKYVVKVIGNGDVVWRSYGITSLMPYALIVGANPELPVHIQATLWDKSSIEHESNRPDVINNKPELQNIKGFYIYGSHFKDPPKIVPDFLRFFRTSGVRLSKEFVSREFCYWESVNKKTGKSLVRLEPIDATKANPVNEAGAGSDVLALGNGYFLEDDPHPTVGINHAYSGDIAPLFDGGHEFFVLMSYVMTHDERLKYTGPSGEVADAFLQQLKDSDGVYYWIYAVRKDAKMSKSFTKSLLAAQTPLIRPSSPAPAQQHPSTPSYVEKRERSVSLSAHASEASDVEHVPETPVKKGRKTAPKKGGK